MSKASAAATGLRAMWHVASEWLLELYFLTAAWFRKALCLAFGRELNPPNSFCILLQYPYDRADRIKRASVVPDAGSTYLSGPIAAVGTMVQDTEQIAVCMLCLADTYLTKT